ncbi:MAG: hypothetical protein OEY14_09290 [Myxococcales bacterium]|nr:hypothetical protein [Myxococcales bacterium]
MSVQSSHWLDSAWFLSAEAAQLGRQLSEDIERTDFVALANALLDAAPSNQADIVRGFLDQSDQREVFDLRRRRDGDPLLRRMVDLLRRDYSDPPDGAYMNLLTRLNRPEPGQGNRIQEVRGAVAPVASTAIGGAPVAAPIAEGDPSAEEAPATDAANMDGLASLYRLYLREQDLFVPAIRQIHSGQSGTPEIRQWEAATDALHGSLSANGFRDVRQFLPLVSTFANDFRAHTVELSRQALSSLEVFLRAQRVRYQSGSEVQTLVASAAETPVPASLRRAHRVLAPDTSHRVIQQQAATSARSWQRIIDAHPLLGLRNFPRRQFTIHNPDDPASRQAMGIWLLSYIDDTLSGVADTSQTLQDSPDFVFQLQDVTDTSLSLLGFGPDSFEAMVVAQEAERLRSGQMVRSVALGILAMALGFFTTGPVGLAAAVGVAALGVYDAVDTFADYRRTQQAYAAQLTRDTPSLLWPALAIAGALLDVGSAIGALRNIRRAFRSFNDGGGLEDLTAAVNRAEGLSEDARVAVIEAARHQRADAQPDLARRLDGLADEAGEVAVRRFPQDSPLAGHGLRFGAHGLEICTTCSLLEHKLDQLLELEWPPSDGRFLSQLRDRAARATRGTARGRIPQEVADRIARDIEAVARSNPEVARHLAMEPDALRARVAERQAQLRPLTESSPRETSLRGEPEGPAGTTSGPTVAPGGGATAAREVMAGLSDDLFRPLQCTNCASAMREALQARGIQGEVLNIRAGGGADFIVNDMVDAGRTSITRNGFHQAVRVGDTVFDNFFRNGVPYEQYVRSLNARFGVDITTTTF